MSAPANPTQTPSSLTNVIAALLANNVNTSTSTQQLPLYAHLPEGYSLLKAITKDDTNLVLYLPLEEGMGTLTQDFSGSIHNATLVSAPTWVAGEIGNALAFVGGSSQYLTVATSTTMSPEATGPMSISCWVYVAALTQTGDIIAKGASSNYEYEVFCDGSGSIFWKCYTASGGATVFNVGSSHMIAGIWNHFVGTFNPGVSAKAYMNGALSATVTPSGVITAGTAVVWVGGRSDAAHYFTGSIDEIRLYNAELSAADVTNLYSASTFTAIPFDVMAVSASGAPANPATLSEDPQLVYAGPQDTNGLISYWPYFENTGLTVGDFGGFFNPMINTSMTWGTGMITAAGVYPNGASGTTTNNGTQLNGYVMSFAAWVYIIKGTGTEEYEFVQGPSFTFYVYNNGALPAVLSSVWTSGNSQLFGNTVTLAAYNAWYHLVQTYDGTNIRTYVNGIIEDTTPEALTAFRNGTKYTVFNRGLANGSKVCEMRIYDIVLSPTEVTTLYNQLAANSGIPFDTMTVQGCSSYRLDSATATVCALFLDSGYKFAVGAGGALDT